MTIVQRYFQMSSLSIRAFDEAQRRQRYPDRRGMVGVACMQRDIITVNKHLSAIAEILWKTSIDSSMDITLPSDRTQANNSLMVQQHLTLAGLNLLQLSGALGMDFVSLLRQAVEKEELTII